MLRSTPCRHPPVPSTSLFCRLCHFLSLSCRAGGLRECWQELQSCRRSRCGYRRGCSRRYVVAVSSGMHALHACSACRTPYRHRPSPGCSPLPTALLSPPLHPPAGDGGAHRRLLRLSRCSRHAAAVHAPPERGGAVGLQRLAGRAVQGGSAASMAGGDVRCSRAVAAAECRAVSRRAAAGRCDGRGGGAAGGGAAVATAGGSCGGAGGHLMCARRSCVHPGTVVHASTHSSTCHLPTPCVPPSYLNYCVPTLLCIQSKMRPLRINVPHKHRMFPTSHKHHHRCPHATQAQGRSLKATVHGVASHQLLL